MALADSVPGVSGGTIAFLLGFYDKFIGSLDALMSGNMQQKKEAVIFLLKLGIGWIVGFLMAVSVLANIRLLYNSPNPREQGWSLMPSSACKKKNMNSYAVLCV